MKLKTKLIRGAFKRGGDAEGAEIIKDAPLCPSSPKHGASRPNSRAPSQFRDSRPPHPFPSFQIKPSAAVAGVLQRPAPPRSPSPFSCGAAVARTAGHTGRKPLRLMWPRHRHTNPLSPGILYSLFGGTSGVYDGIHRARCTPGSAGY